MNTIRVSATAARNRFFELLDQVAHGMEVVIEKDKKEVALRKASEAAHGILKDYSIEEIAPLRKKGAWKRFGKWDLGLDLSIYPL